MSTFQERLNYLLQSTRTKQQQLSVAANIDKTSISKYCNGKAVPDSRNLLKIANYFDVSPTWLSGDDTTSVPPKEDMPFASIDISKLSPSAIEFFDKFTSLTDSEQQAFFKLAKKLFGEE